MQPSLYTYNSTAINDGTNYRAMFDYEFYAQAKTTIVEVQRHRASPAFVDVGFVGVDFKIFILLMGTGHSQIATLKALFDAQDTSYRTLVFKDTANSDKQWYRSCKCTASYLQDQTTFVAEMHASDPVWTAVTGTTGTVFNPTATGQTADFTPSGTLRIRPVIDISPQAAKTGGRAYSRFWRVYNATVNAFTNYGYDITGGGLDTAALVTDTSKSNQINQGGGITNSATTIPIDTAVGGGLPAVGMGIVDTEQIRWTGNSGTQLTGVTRGIGGTTAATHADNAVIKRSKMLANGDDVAVIYDGVSIPRWFGTGSNAMNQAATKIFISLDLAPKMELTIASITDVATTLTIQDTPANRKVLQSLQSTGILLLESELITYTAKDTKALTISGLKRGTKGSTAAAHSAGVTARRIQHDAWLAYGDQSASDPTTAADYNDKKPIFALTSTNTSWVYSSTGFRTVAGKRAGEWIAAVLTSLCKDPFNRQSQFYGADAGSSTPVITLPDPATEMGMRIASFLNGVVYKQETAQVEWRLYHPAGVTTVTATGEKYRATTSWPTATFQKSSDGKNWSIVWTEATPSSAATWENWASHSSVSLSGTYNYLRLLFSGGQSAASGSESDSECDAITLTLDSATVPQMSLASEASAYDLNCTLTNEDDSSVAMAVRYRMEVGETLRIDGENKKVTYLKDNSNAFSAVTGWPSTASGWLELIAGVANTIRYDETGVTDVDITVSWHDRQN